MNYNITYADGGNDNSATMAGACKKIANRYGVAKKSLVTNNDGARTLVWLDEASAENDDGANAVAEIQEKL